MPCQPCSQLGHSRQVERGANNGDVEISPDHDRERGTSHRNWLAEAPQQTKQPKVDLYLFGFTLQ